MLTLLSLIVIFLTNVLFFNDMKEMYKQINKSVFGILLTNQIGECMQFSDSEQY